MATRFGESPKGFVAEHPEFQANAAVVLRRTENIASLSHVGRGQRATPTPDPRPSSLPCTHHRLPNHPPSSTSQAPAKDKRTPCQSLRRENRVLSLHIRRLPLRPPRSGSLRRRRWSSPMSSAYDRESPIAPLRPGALARADSGESGSAADRSLRQVRPGVWTWIGPAVAEPQGKPQEKEAQRIIRRHPDIISPDEPDTRQGGRSGSKTPRRGAP